MTPGCTASPRARSGVRQRGGFLLEALVGIAIMSFGILGIVGLQAQSIRWVNDAQYRSEAVYHANAVISRMWAEDPAVLKTSYGDTAGAGFKDFRKSVETLPHAAEDDYAPEITVEAGPSINSSLVTVTVRWRLTDENTGGFDTKGGSQYVTAAVLGTT